MSKIKGLDELLSKLASLGGNTEASAEMGLQRGAKIIQKNAKMLTPVDTGSLRNSIKTQSERKNGNIEAKVYTSKDYAPYVEFGTGERGRESNIERPTGVSYSAEWKGQTAQPFMTPAFLHAKASKEVEQEVIKSVQNEIKRLGGK